MSVAARPLLAVQQIVRRITRLQVDAWLLVGVAVGLLGCPLLLDDDFSIEDFRSFADAGEPCIGSTCYVPYSNVGGSSGADDGESGGASGASSAGGSGSGSSGSSGAAGSAAGSSGASGSAGSGAAGADNSGGSSGAGSAGTGSSGASGSAGAAGAGSGENPCWTLELNDGTHDSSSNCLDIAGINKIEKDTGGGTSLTLSYEGGDPCFNGTIGASGWGATFEFSFTTANTWDATAEGVTGFEFAYRGSAQPPTIRVMYKDSSGVDNCRAISPGTTAVPFTAAHPSCSTSSAAAVVDATDMDEMILAIVPSGGQAFPVDFCVQIRALD